MGGDGGGKWGGEGRMKGGSVQSLRSISSTLSFLLTPLHPHFWTNRPLRGGCRNVPMLRDPTRPRPDPLGTRLVPPDPVFVTRMTGLTDSGPSVLGGGVCVRTCVLVCVCVFPCVRVERSRSINTTKGEWTDVWVGHSSRDRGPVTRPKDRRQAVSL